MIGKVGRFLQYECTWALVFVYCLPTIMVLNMLVCVTEKF